MKLLGISGSLTAGSRTNEVVRLVLDQAAAAEPEVEPELLDPRAYNIAFCDGRNPADYTGDTRTVIDMVAAADAYVVGSPSYRGSYTGALKNLFDLLPNDAPQGKVAGIVLTAGSDHHFLAIEHQLRPLLSFFHMHTVPGCGLRPECALQGRSLGRRGGPRQLPPPRRGYRPPVASDAGRGKWT